jgi:hypothetical protein
LRPGSAPPTVQAGKSKATPEYGQPPPGAVSSELKGLGTGDFWLNGADWRYHYASKALLQITAALFETFCRRI